MPSCVLEVGIDFAGHVSKQALYTPWNQVKTIDHLDGYIEAINT
jgi:hypothetical protein